MTRPLSELADGTGVRFKHLEGSGWEYVTVIRDGRIVGPRDELRSPSRAAQDLDEIIRGEEAHDGWGPSDWEWFSGDGWQTLTRDE